MSILKYTLPENELVFLIKPIQSDTLTLIDQSNLVNLAMYFIKNNLCEVNNFNGVLDAGKMLQPTSLVGDGPLVVGFTKTLYSLREYMCDMYNYSSETFEGYILYHMNSGRLGTTRTRMMSNNEKVIYGGWAVVRGRMR